MSLYTIAFLVIRVYNLILVVIPKNLKRTLCLGHQVGCYPTSPLYLYYSYSIVTSILGSVAGLVYKDSDYKTPLSYIERP